MRRFLVAALAGALLASIQTSDNQPADPFRVADHVYYVGASDIASYLITTSEGHILIDAGYVETVPIIRGNVAKMGFRIEDVKILLNTQAHFDHAGGFAELKRLTGARLMASGEDGAMIERGGRGDFNLGDTRPFPAATIDRYLADGDVVRLGDVALTAHLTPGHTKGCTTWTWDARDRRRVYHVVDLCGLSILDGTRVSGMPAYPQIASDYERTFATLKKLPCDIFLGAHAGYYDGRVKAAKLASHPEQNPFVDPDGYRAYIDRAEQKFRDQRAREIKD
jgi:metallo-beta-lactamase class B